MCLCVSVNVYMLTDIVCERNTPAFACLRTGLALWD